MRRIAAFLTLILFVVVTAAPAFACLAQGDAPACCCKASSDASTAICPVDCCSPGRPVTPRPDRSHRDLLLRIPLIALLPMPMPEDAVLRPRVPHRSPAHSLIPPLRLRI
ncbi:MAG TPA: hypothetical protein VH877_30545 [Polyangia bacterium]|jgi:hypothetical protein|nr:hypothetical protein [Polyangia bacterium]